MALDGKVAIVTGGTRGIGLAIARALCAAGAQVMICGRDSSTLDSAVASLSQVNAGCATGRACDVRRYSEVDALVRSTVDQFGGVDILVNNAGVAVLGNVEVLSPESWQAVLETNLTGAYHCCHAVIPALRRRGGGYIINVASRSGINAFSGGAAYCASKFGLIGFSEALMQEVRRDHIRVSYVMPGRVSTDFAGEPPQPWHLMPEDVAKVVLDMLAHDRRTVVSRVEIRPAEPPTS